MCVMLPVFKVRKRQRSSLTKIILLFQRQFQEGFVKTIHEKFSIAIWNLILTASKSNENVVLGKAGF